MKRIHIVGVSARTGTTLLAECMRRCFNVDRYEKHEASLNTMRWGSSIYLTKNPQDIMYLNLRLTLDPRLTVICMIRDPRDVISSKHADNPNKYRVSLGEWKYKNKLVQQYLNNDRFITIRYEDLIDNPNATQNYIMSKIEYLEETKSFSDFHEGGSFSEQSVRALNGVRPIDKNSKSIWRNHLPRISDQLIKYGDVTDELKQYGYDIDNQWIELLSNNIDKNSDSSSKINEKYIHSKKYYITHPMSAVLAFLCDKLSIRFG